MARLARRWSVASAVALCLGGAGLEARHLGRERLARVDPCGARPADRGAVEASFAEVLAARAAGRGEEALLTLRQRAERGPYPGYAWFLLGELAVEAGAFGPAVKHFRRAVEVDPGVADRGTAFGAARAVEHHLETLRASAWAQANPPELRDLHYLRRRLAGGCE